MMFFELFGYIVSSILIGLIILWKLTNDIYPYGLKKFITRCFLQNWRLKQPKILIEYNPLNAKCTNDIGIIATENEIQLEKPVKLRRLMDTDELIFYGIDEIGNGISTQIKKRYNDFVEASISLILDGRRYSISKSAKIPNASNSQEFSLGNLKFELVEPMRAWRIWYNGIMMLETTDLTEDEENEINMRKDENNANDDAQVRVHAVLNLLWKPLDCPFDCRKDVNIDLLSDYLAKNGKFGSNFDDLQANTILPNGYTQLGILNGIIKIGTANDSEAKVIRCSPFYGHRQRYFPGFKHDLLSYSNKIQESIELYGFCDFNGNAFRLTGVTESWTDGYILYASTEKNPILHVDVESREFLGISASLPKFFTITDQKTSFHVEIWPKFTKHVIDNQEFTLFKLSINGKNGHGILLKRKITDEAKIEKMLLKSLITNYRNQEQTATAASEEFLAVVSFDSIECQDVNLVGGKGASLAKLASMAKNDLGLGNIEKFGTSYGFCVTTDLFSKILDQKIIMQIFDDSTDVELASKKVMDFIRTSNAKDLVRPHINTMLYKLFDQEESSNGNSGKQIDKMKFAVRSSGTLEDMADLSCAGQNETFLNVSFELISEKVVDCWASLFTTQSVYYRLNHGQPIWCEMGVVVQEMVDPKCAGVLFTADPRTGNPFRIMINGNFGLGESVVSGICTPDTFILQRSFGKENPGQLEIVDKLIGAKTVKIVCDFDNGVTKQLELDENGNTFCLEDETLLKLGAIGLEIEKELGNFRPIDIEWAVDKNGKVIVLQTRSMTSLDSWTDDEIIHEMDTATRTTFEPLTTANTGEVLPGATSTLGHAITTRFLDVSICSLLATMNNDRLIPYTSRSTSIYRQRLLLNIFSLYRNVDSEVGPPLAALELTLFGHRIDSEKYHAFGKERFGIQSTSSKLKFLPRAAIDVWESSRDIKRVIKKYTNYGPDKAELMKKNDPLKVYELVTGKLYDLLDIGTSHCRMSQTSSIINLFAFLTLASGQKVEDWTTELYEDISKLLSVGVDVESADIPNAMNQLASTIANYHNKVTAEEFTKQSPENALKLIQEEDNNNELLNKALNLFMKKHGHRGYAELDVMRQSWKTDPLPLIKLLQSLVSNKLKYNEMDYKVWSIGSKFNNDDELLDSLNTEITPGTRRFLKFILKYCRTAVKNRETTKSLLVKTLEGIKIIYNHLAKLLVKENLIRDPKLIYFMTHYEIGLVIKRDSSIARILYKSMKRYKLHPDLNKEQCPEIIDGKYDPAEVDDSNIQLGDSITATPLSTGKVQGTVTVCLTVDDASKLLKPGDILITRGTDIAWSPFFPMLGGVVTELGGLMSHGAVVAREYGLPCVVGALNATRIFKTGENVILDAGKGTVTKVIV